MFGPGDDEYFFSFMFTPPDKNAEHGLDVVLIQLLNTSTMNYF